MKKLIFLVVCLLAGGMPVFSQTYQELCDRAITYTEQDSLPQAEEYIRQALKLEPANPHNALLFPISVRYSVVKGSTSRLWSLITLP